MAQESAIGSNKIVKQLELLTPENGKFLGWQNGSPANLTIAGDPRIICSGTAPTVRSDGSALQVQDQWRNTLNGLIYYWFYDSWYEESREMVLTSDDPTTRSASISLYGNIFTSKPLLIESLTVSGRRTGNTHSGTAYWAFGISSLAENSSTLVSVLLATISGTPNSIGGSINTLFWGTYVFPSPVLVTVNNRLILDYSERAGAVSVTNVSSSIKARWIYV